MLKTTEALAYNSAAPKQSTGLSGFENWFVALLLICVCTAVPRQSMGSEEEVLGGVTYGLLDSLSGAPEFYGWKELESRAQLYGGHLVTITDPGLNFWLRDKFSAMPFVEYAAIGLNYHVSWGAEGSKFAWRWASDGSSPFPLYRAFAPGYPRLGVNNEFDGDGALMRLSDGCWVDICPEEPGPTEHFAGIYEVYHGSSVPMAS